MRSLVASVALSVVVFLPLSAPISAHADAPPTSPFQGKYVGELPDVFGETWYVDLNVSKDGEIKGDATYSYDAAFSGRVSGVVVDNGSAMDLTVRYHSGSGAGNEWMERLFHFDSVFDNGAELFVYESSGAEHVLIPR